MCTIHVVKCPDCASIPSARRQPCKDTPPHGLCRRGLTNHVTTFLLPLRCEACLAKNGPYHALPNTSPADDDDNTTSPLEQRSSFDSLSSNRMEHYEWRLRAMWKRLATKARTMSSCLDEHLSRLSAGVRRTARHHRLGGGGGGGCGIVGGYFEIRSRKSKSHV
ncbi:hypothetical protein CMUS01_15769 [Colletotrichum musicola]|uniref:Uncharacterized protein n=1 Tax=Colletotrichum musicola TaxID=2175873 RepID=A0A8H6IUF2_9PEZI|nr:hypothetical protein CMUS01_15769 [Colletotrichum musicola]